MYCVSSYRHRLQCTRLVVPVDILSGFGNFGQRNSKAENINLECEENIIPLSCPNLVFFALVCTRLSHCIFHRQTLSIMQLYAVV